MEEVGKLARQPDQNIAGEMLYLGPTHIDGQAEGLGCCRAACLADGNQKDVAVRGERRHVGIPRACNSVAKSEGEI